MGNLLVSDNMTTTSLIIAEHFGKAHKNVLQAIDNLGCSEQFSRLNFQPSDFVNSRGKTYKGYVITRDGFSMLVMGFTGTKAMQWKEKFLAAFNAMEKALLKQSNDVDWKAARLQLKSVRQETTDAIKDFVTYATAQGSQNAKMYYANITNMEYKALGLLQQAKQTEGNFRDTLDLLQISQLQLAETLASKAIQKGMQDELHYKEIYIYAKQKIEDFASSLTWLLPRPQSQSE
jgi:Rha family phage regulatory protein